MDFYFKKWKAICSILNVLQVFFFFIQMSSSFSYKISRNMYVTFFSFNMKQKWLCDWLD